MPISGHETLMKVLRYLISGGTAAVVNLGVLYMATEFLGIWYLLSACLAFGLSFVVSFTLQKFWTFRDRSVGLLRRQALLYFLVAIGNLLLDMLVLYILVEYAGLHYIGAQIITMGAIAILSFFIYRKFIFKTAESAHSGDGRNISTFLPLSHVAILAVAALILVLIPFVRVTSQLGHPPRLPVAAYNDGDYYFDRVQEVKDGHPFIGNPYFIEHRNDLPPAFFIADWLGAIPTLLGIPLMASVQLSFFGWSLLFLILAYLILKCLELSPRLALVGSVLAFSEVYVFMIRPVSMQVIFPFFLLFLLAFIVWLREPEDRFRQVFLGLTAAAAAAMYTYSWQIILCVFLVSAAVFLLIRRSVLRALVIPSLLCIILLAPVVWLTVQQINHPFYLETLERIGLIHTRLPIFAGFVIAIVPTVIGLLAFLTRPREIGFFAWLRTPAVFFFTTTGISIVGVMFSNVVTGLDLELPQHIARFVVVWFVFASLYLLPRVWEFLRGKTGLSRKLAILALYAAVLVGHAYYQKEYGLKTVFFPYSVEQMKSVQDFVTPLVWLADNAREPSVVWTDPDGAIGNYVTMLTQHYVLFRAGGALHLVSNAEVEDRYLAAHFFSLPLEHLIEDYQAYGGVGNAIHAYKTQNRRVLVCRLLLLQKFGVSCGELTDRVSFKGKAYFDTLMAKYQTDTRKNIYQKLVAYKVSYIIADRETDTPMFKPEKLPHTKEIYDDGRFIIYSVNPTDET